MMKRLISIALTLAMLMSTSVFAAEVTADGGMESCGVKATLVEGSDASPIVYSVEIKWDEMEFTYYEESAASWNSETLQYDTGYRAEGWKDGDEATVTIENSSNTEILASFEYAARAGYESATMNFAANELYIASADNGDGTGSVKTASNTVTPDGKLETAAENAEIGTITITIEQCANITCDTARTLLNSTMTAITSWYRGSSWEGFKGVDNASEVGSGEGYVLKSDVEEFNNNVFEPFDTFLSYIDDSDLTAEQQSEVNQKYYSYKAAWENFLATKCHIK